MLADVRQQLLVLVRVADALGVALHHEDAKRLPVGLEGNAEPARVLRDDADELDLALLGQFQPPLVREQLGLARAEHVGRRAFRGTGAQLLPDVGVGPIGIQLVDVERPVDHLPSFVVERDEEVVRVHQLADDAVYRRVELLHIVGGARRLGDAVEGVLDLLGAAALRPRRPPAPRGARGRRPAWPRASPSSSGRHRVDYRANRSRTISSIGWAWLRAAASSSGRMGLAT